MDCARCNGELAKAMLAECTPEQLAHAYVHAVSREHQLRTALERLDRENGCGRTPIASDWTAARLALAYDGARIANVAATIGGQS
jgi:hypothetical protein